MRTTLIHPGDVVYLGRQGENGALQVQFDVSGWAETHGNGVFALIIRRPGETTPYPITVVAVDEVVHWTVHAYDTALAGEGELQLQYYVEDDLAQTEVHMTLVTESINVDDPDPYISWFEKMNILAEEAAASATAAASSAESAEESASAASASADIASASEESASASADSAATSEGSASDSAQTATEKAVMAESWAVGGTDSRQGEDTDNAMYYAGQAASSAESAQSSAEYVDGKAEEIAGVVQTFTESTAPGAVASVQDEGATQVAAVRGEGTTQVAAVRSEGTDQVASVATAGEQALSAVQFSVDSAATSATAAASSATDANNAKAGAVTAQGLAETAQAAAATSATQAAGSATQAAGSATAAGNSATAAANSATNANSAMTAAETAQANAEASEEAASTFAQTASDQAVLAESWAVGGTGTRTDEDTDNAEYYAGQAAGSVQAAQSAAETSASYSSAAAGYATAAANSATAAGNSATAASSFATAASNSATSAAGYAAQAGDAKNAAETAQANAEAAFQGAADEGAHQIVLIEAAGDAERASLSGYATQAATSADNAATSATAASGSAANAAASATAASGSAAAAAGSATNAASSASQASSSASSASSRATQASDSATAAVNAATAAVSSAQQAAQSAADVQAYKGSPLVAATGSAMTETDHTYVYTGSEAGLTAGHWYYYDGTDWADGGIYNAVAVQTDTTLTVADTAADAKAAGDAISDVKSTVDSIGDSKSVLSTDATAIDYTINNQNKWVSAASSDASAGLYNLSGAEKVSVTPQNGVIAVWAFLDTLNPALGETPDYSTGFAGRITSNANRPYDYTVTADMHYLYVAITNSSGATTFPQNLTIKYAVKTDKTLTKNNVPADAKAVGDALSVRADVKLAMLGDSITNGKVGGSSSAVPELTIPQAVAKYLGVTTQNFGVNGMGWISKANYSVNAYEYIQTLDLSTFTHVSLAYGTNDSAAVLGTASDTTEETILGSAYRVCNYIHTQWPNLVIYIILPILGKSGGSFPDWGWGIERGPTGDHWYFKDFYDAFDAFGEKYHIPIIHGDKSLNSWNVDNLIGDNVHPTIDGYKVIGHYVAGQIGALI